MLSQHRDLWNSPIVKTIVISVHCANAVYLLGFCLVIAWLLLDFCPGAWCFCFFVLSQETRASLMVIPELQRSSDGETIRCCNDSI